MIKKKLLGILMAGTVAMTALPLGVCAANAAQDTNKEQTTASAEQGGTAEEKKADETERKPGVTMTAAEAKAAGTTVYINDPMQNPKAVQDIIVNEKAVYGYSPSPESTRLKEYVDAIDWTNPEQVAAARQERIEYHEREDELYQIIEKMLSENKSTEEIARAVSKRRNELRLENYKDDPEGLARVKKSNLDTYGDENGPTIEWLLEKYGTWEKILDKALSSNPGMDACLGLYDDFYYTYDLADKVTVDPDHVDADPASVDEGQGATTYKVKDGDNLWKLSEKFYGDGAHWRLIYDANNDKISDPAKLEIGTELTIPPKDQE